MSGTSKLGLAEVARLAGVSTATVSNVLNRPHMVSAETQAKVRATIAELDFTPNRAAATLRKGHNRLLGLVIPEVTNPFYSAITDAVSDSADENGYAVALCVTHDDPTRELRHFSILAEQRAVGALVVPYSAAPSRLAQLRMVGTRLILIDRVATSDEGCSVVIDDVLGGGLAVEHLFRSRGPRVALVNGDLAIPQCADRREGARAAFSGAGRDPDTLIEIEAEAMTIEAGFAVGRMLTGSPLPDGVFCANDQLAVGVIRGLADAGVQTPGDISVVGYGDLALATEGTLSLTSIAQPKRDMGARAVSKLLEELQDGAAHRHSSTTLRPELVVRGSAP